MHHLGVTDELEGHEGDGAVEVVVGDRVLVAVDSDEREPVDVLDLAQPRADRARLGELERDATRVASQLGCLGGGTLLLRPLIVTRAPRATYSAAS